MRDIQAHCSSALHRCIVLTPSFSSVTKMFYVDTVIYAIERVIIERLKREHTE